MPPEAYLTLIIKLYIFYGTYKKIHRYTDIQIFTYFLENTSSLNLKSFASTCIWYE